MALDKKECLKEMMSSEQGRNAIEWIINMCEIYTPSTGKETDKETWMKEGKRVIGLEILRAIDEDITEISSIRDSRNSVFRR